MQLWPGILELAAAELALINNTTPAVYLAVDMTLVSDESDVEAHMAASFFTVCNTVLEPESIVVQVQKEDIQGIPASCASPILGLPGHPLNALRDLSS